MKKFIKGAVILVATYMSFAFIMANIDFTSWPINIRFYTIIIAAIFIFVFLMLTDDTPPQMPPRTFHRPKPPTKPPTSR